MGKDVSGEPWYVISETRSLETPALIIYYDRLLANIRRLKKMVGDDSRIRPHVKTSKMPEVCRLLQQHYITRFKCATIAEAEMLAQINASDVLLAYPLIGPDLDRWLQLVQRYPKTAFSFLVSNQQNAEVINKRALAAKTQLLVFIDIDAGMHRTGIAVKKVAALYQAMSKMRGLEVVGLHVYDGHLKMTDPEQRQKRSDQIFAPIEALRNQLSQKRPKSLKLVIGGSPSFSTHIKRIDTELSPGTFVFWDMGYGTSFPDLPFEPAALVITRVIDVLDNGTCTLDLGTKALASEMPFPRVKFLNYPDLSEVFHSEEHLNVRLKEGSQGRLPEVGELLYGVPYHICPTVALYDHGWVVVDGKITEQWQVQARRRKINF